MPRSILATGNTMKRSFDAVVIGGGVMGCSSAYWLSKHKGMKVAVVERDTAYKQACSVLAAGGIRMQFSNKENIMLSRSSLEWLKEEDVLKEVMFKEHGYLLLAATDQGTEVLKENQSLQNNLGSNTHVANPEELQNLFPWLNTEGISTGSYGRSQEGWFDPSLMLNALKNRAKALGVEFINGEATQVHCKAGQVRSVDVVKGSDTAKLNTGVLVNAAGTRGKLVAQQCGWSDFPVRPRKRFVFQVQSADWVHDFKKGAFFPPIAEAHKPMPLTVDPTGVWVRPEGVGFICGMSPNATQDPDVGYDDFDITEDADELWMDHMWPTLAERVKGFEALKVASIYAGHYEYNVEDQNAVIGTHPSASNVFYINGFSGHGIQQAPAAGRAISELVVDGAFKTIDLTRMSPKRFAAGELLIEKNVV